MNENNSIFKIDIFEILIIENVLKWEKYWKYTQNTMQNNENMQKC